MDFKKLFRKIFLLFSVQILGLTLMSMGGLGLNSNAQASPITAMSDGDCYICDALSNCDDAEGDQEGGTSCNDGGVSSACRLFGSMCGGGGNC